MAGRKSKYEKNIKITDHKIWKVAEYIRLSQEDYNNSIEEKKESNSITSQKTLLQEYIKEHQDLEFYDHYIDDGYTGTDFNRPGFQRMLEDMKNRKINCILVKDLSRLGRNYIEVGNYIEQIFPLFDIRFIAINDNIDSYKDPNSTNTILLPFKNLINDEYCRDTSLKIRSALNGRKKKGEYVGAFPAYGYIKSKEDYHKLIVDKESAQIVRKIFNWYVNEGMGCLSICHKLNDIGVLNPTGYKRKILKQNYKNYNIQQEDYSWTTSTVRKILSNDVYIGNITQGKRKVKSYKIHKLEQIPEEEWITVKNMHEPIIDKKLFEKAQDIRKKDTRIQKDGKLSLWAGKIKCKDCGKAMNKKTSKNKIGTIYQYYICSTYQKKSHELCTKHTIRLELIEKAVLQTIQEQITNLANVESIVKKLQETPDIANHNISILKEKQREIEKIQNLKKALYQDWKNNDITKEEYILYKKDYEQEIEKLKIIIENIEKENENEIKIKQEKMKEIEEFKKQKNIIKLDKTIIEELIESIEICENKKIIIHFKFKN